MQYLLKSLQEIGFSADPDAELQNAIEQLSQADSTLDNELSDIQTEAEPSIFPSEIDIIDELPSLKSLDNLKTLDVLTAAGAVSDLATIEFLICNKINSIWQAVLTESSNFNVEDFKVETGGHYFKEIKRRFFEQYEGAINLLVPVGYSFRKNGILAWPNLMQRLTAYRVLTEKRVGNWSGVGSGKTISAILTSRVIDARLTVIVAFNSTIESWSKVIADVFPDSEIIVKERGAININPAKHTYLLFNYESFQQPDAAEMVRRLVEEQTIDFVVLDEIHNVKQRTKNVVSLRRSIIENLLQTTASKNPSLRVLGMSATPVINNLYEAKALLELTMGREFDELETANNVSNALTIHQQLMINGLRYKPAYKQLVETVCLNVPGEDYRYQLRAATSSGSLLNTEQVLLAAKMPAILANLRKGTMIYTLYVEGIIEPLRAAIEAAGYKVGIFTGQDKTGVRKFEEGTVDILIGSKPIGEGHDGLQYVCNRVIIVSLPWTSAAQEQLIGRLQRQGALFDKVEVIIPQVVLSNNGDEWSWDRMRLNRIEYKKTLADAAMDGIIPEGALISEEEMLVKAGEALRDWITRLEKKTFIVQFHDQLSHTAHV